MIRSQSVYHFLEKRGEKLPFTGAWYDAFAEPDPFGTWFVYGDSGSGKTSFLLQLAKYFDEDLRQSVAYMSLEEYGRRSLQDAIVRAGWRRRRSKIQMLPPCSCTDLSRWLDRSKVRVLIIDTVQYWALNYEFTIDSYFWLKERHKDCLLVFNSHVKGNDPDGRLGVQIMRDADQKIFVQGFRAISKGRNAGTLGYYVIWPERERVIWLT